MLVLPQKTLSGRPGGYPDDDLIKFKKKKSRKTVENPGCLPGNQPPNSGCPERFSGCLGHPDTRFVEPWIERQIIYKKIANFHTYMLIYTTDVYYNNCHGGRDAKENICNFLYYISEQRLLN